MKQKVMSVCCLCIAIVFNTLAQEQYDEKAKSILDAMSENYKSTSAFKASFTNAIHNPQEGINEEFKGEITIKGEMFRLVMEEQEVINNGTTIWTYLKEANEVNIDNYSPDDDDMTPSKIYTAYKEGYKYLYLEEVTEGAVKYDIIDLVPEDKSVQFFKIRMKIDKGAKTLKSWKIFDRNGTRYEYTIDKYQPNVEVGDTSFTFVESDYSGVEVIDLR